MRKARCRSEGPETSSGAWYEHRAGAAIVLAVSTILSGAMPLAGQDSPRLSLEPLLFEADSGQEVNAELGRLQVSENRSLPEPRRIEIAFVRLPSRAQQPGPPIVYLAGGPGGSGIRAGRGSRFALFDSLRQAGDVILLDQRGTGRSTRIEPEDCPETRQLPTDRPLELAAHLAAAEELAAACAAFWRQRGVDMAAYNTVESAEDLEVLRQALGVEKLDLLGISYGTHLALAYLRRHPERVRRAVLAGAEGPDHTIKLPQQFERQLDKVDTMLAAQSEVARGRRGVRDLVRQLLERLDRQPAILRVRNVEGPDTESTLVVGRREVAQALMSRLQDPDSLRRIALLLRQLEAGDYTDLAGTLAGMRELGELEAMPEAMDGASGISTKRHQRLLHQDETTLLGSGILQANIALARGLGVPDLGPGFRAPIESAVPTLFISGDLDGRTPVENALDLLPGFPNGSHFLVRGGGHGDDLLIATAELRQAILDFFLGRQVRLRETVKPPGTAPLRQRISLTPAQAARYVGEYERRPREIWRILHQTTLESLSPQGEILFSNAVLQIRWSGNGFPFHPLSETEFFVDFPWLLDHGFRFELDDGRVTHLVITTADGETIRLEKVH